MLRASRLLLWVLLLAACPLAAADSHDACLVIGEQLDPPRARQRFGEALQAWRTGRTGKALDLYEEALIADRSVLDHDDDGMAPALLERIRRQVETATPTTALLCRQGFFENIIIGNLESAIERYRQAADLAATDEDRAVSRRETQRLSQELAYIRNWQELQQKRLAALRRQDEAAWKRREQLEGREARLEALGEEKAELEERLSYLRSQESETRSTMLTSLERRSRARRYYYYRDNPQGYVPPPPTTYPGPGLGQIPVPPPGGPGPLVPVSPQPLPGGGGPGPLVDTPPLQSLPQTGLSADLPDGNPLADQVSGMDPSVGNPEDLDQYYLYRRKAKEQNQEINHIRAEIAGVERRIKAIDKEIARLRKEWADEDRAPAPNPGSAPAGLPAAGRWTPKTID